MRYKDCYCHSCDIDIHHLGIMSHRAMHRRKKEDCEITFSTGKTYYYNYSMRPNTASTQTGLSPEGEQAELSKSDQIGHNE